MSDKTMKIMLLINSLAMIAMGIMITISLLK